MQVEPATYECRRRRSEWPESVCQDPEVQEVDEEKGEWVLCRTCAEHYERTRRGRKPNDIKGFKVKMNGRYQEAAWVMHKSRVVTHRGNLEPCEGQEQRKQETQVETRRNVAKRPRDIVSEEEEVEEEGGEDTEIKSSMELVHLPTTGWRCPGIVPDDFYRDYVDLVHAFAKYYVGAQYRVNVVRDIRSDKALLFSHDCENQVVYREKLRKSYSCERCYSIWLHHKSFKRILKKMDRYTLVEDILRHSWSLTTEELSVLSNFKQSSNMNLNLEGRKLKQAAMTASTVQHYGRSVKNHLPCEESFTAITSADHSDHLEHLEKPLSMDMILELHSMDSSVYDERASISEPSTFL